MLAHQPVTSSLLGISVYRTIMAAAVAKWLSDYWGKNQQFRRQAQEDFINAATNPNEVPLLEMLSIQFGMEPSKVLEKIFEGAQDNIKPLPKPDRRSAVSWKWSNARPATPRRRVAPIIPPRRKPLTVTRAEATTRPAPKPKKVRPQIRISNLPPGGFKVKLLKANPKTHYFTVHISISRDIVEKVDAALIRLQQGHPAETLSETIARAILLADQAISQDKIESVA